jgi:hypothetical protein
MWHSEIWLKSTDVSEKRTASIFRVEDQEKKTNSTASLLLLLFDLRRQSISARPHGVTSHTIISIITAVGIVNLTVTMQILKSFEDGSPAP